MKESDVQAAMDADFRNRGVVVIQPGETITSGWITVPNSNHCAVSEGALLWPQQQCPADSLYEECLAMQGEPEIPVTAEMIAAGAAAHMATFESPDVETYAAIYRAMTALAPKDMFDASARDHAEAWANECMARIAALEAENATLLWLHNDMADRLNALTGGPMYPTPAPRRPDGTLVPASKPWAPPKDSGDKRRIGG